jgi:type I restriction enzyme, S subunit
MSVRIEKGVTLSRLGDECETTSGGTPSRSIASYYGGGIPWVKSGELNDGTIMRTEETLSKLGLERSAAKVFPARTLLIALYGATVGKLAILGTPAATNQAVCAIFPSERVCTEFLFYYLLSQREHLLDKRTGGAQPNISQDVIRELSLPLLDLSEQGRVAGRLEQADRLRRTRRYALELTETLLPAAFLEFFGDPQRNPRNWDRGIIDDVLIFSQYGTSQKSNPARHGYPVLGMGNITDNGSLGLSALAYVELPKDDFEKLALKRGDIIFNRTNSSELVGKTACWNLDMDAVLASYLVRLRLKPEVLPEFFSAMLNTRYFKNLFRDRCKKAVGQSNISPTLLREFPVYIPPLPLQQKFVALVHRVERLRAVQCEALRQAEHLFASLLDRAFSG